MCNGHVQRSIKVVPIWYAKFRLLLALLFALSFPVARFIGREVRTPLCNYNWLVKDFAIRRRRRRRCRQRLPNRIRQS